MASLKTEKFPQDKNFIAPNEILDVLLDKGVKKATAQKTTGTEDEEIYDLVVEEGHVDYSKEIAVLTRQVEQLSREQEALHLQLKNALIASNNLSKQLIKLQKKRSGNRLAFLVACLALVAVAALANIGWEMQQKFTHIVVSSDSQIAAAKQVTARLDEMDDKVTQIFKAENSDNLLQITRALKEQVGVLADSHLSIANSQPAKAAAQQPASPKASAPNHKKPVDKKESAPVQPNPPKSESAQKAVPDMPELETKPAQVKTKDSTDKKSTLKNNWVIGLGSYRDKDTAKRRLESFKKAGANVQLIEIKTQNRILYRIVAKTTKTKQEVENYAERMKKTLKLDSVSVNKN